MSRRTHVFPYGITLREGGTVSVFPAAQIVVATPQEGLLTFVLVVDSGATISALPISDAPFFGIKDVQKGLPLVISGVGQGSMKGWKHFLTVHLQGERIRIPFVFLENTAAPRILGREGIFDRYTVIFEERNRRTSFAGLQGTIAPNVRALVSGVVKDGH